MAKAGPQRKAAAAYVDIKATKVKKNRDGVPMVLCKTSSKTVIKKGGVAVRKPGGTASTYVTTVEVYPKHQVIVGCSCEDFTYTWEVALNRRGAARIEYSNGEDPGEKNPSYVPGCCKHLIAVGQMLIDKGKL